MPEEESLEATSENRHRGCGRDMLGQTVPSMGNSNYHPSVFLSVTREDQSKTVEVSIMQLSPQSSPIPL